MVCDQTFVVGKTEVTSQANKSQMSNLQVALIPSVENLMPLWDVTRHDLNTYFHMSISFIHNVIHLQNADYDCGENIFSRYS